MPSLGIGSNEAKPLSALLLAGLVAFALAFACGKESADQPSGPAGACEECMPRAGSGGWGGSADEPGGGSMGGSLGGTAGAAGSASSAESGAAGVAGDAMVPDNLEQRIDAAVESIRADTCFAGDDTSLCEWADYDVAPARFDMAKSTGEAVLVIDDFGAGFNPGLVRYRNRLRGVYRVAGDELKTQAISAHLPKRLGDALVSFAGPEFIAASSLARVGTEANATYRKLNLLYYGHGGLIFGHLVELVPEAPLVLLELAELLALPPSVCAGINDATLAAATSHFAAVAQSLKQIMTDEHVHFINASFGSTVPNLAIDWARTCASATPNTDDLRRMLHMYDPIYDVLFDTDGVITAHAAADLGDPADYPFDQLSASFPNRVRVGFISSRDSGLDELGRGVLQQTQQLPGSGDADVYVNWRCEAQGGSIPLCAEPHYEFAGPYGLGTGTVPIMSTSYVNPLAVARLANLRYGRHRNEPMTNALVQTLRRELTPPVCGTSAAEPCRNQDPFVHRQLESYRLGYK